MCHKNSKFVKIKIINSKFLVFYIISLTLKKKILQKSINTLIIENKISNNLFPTDILIILNCFKYFNWIVNTNKSIIIVDYKYK